MEDTEFFEKILHTSMLTVSTKLDAITQLLKQELEVLKKEIDRLENRLELNTCADSDESKDNRETVIRLHNRLDKIEDRLTIVEKPKKLAVREIIKTKAIEWSVPITFAFIFFLLYSGALTSFGKLIFGVP